MYRQNMNYQKIHFIGICGAGMSAVSKLCKDMGVIVSGSDEGFYPPISEYILENNIPFIKGFSKDNIKEDVNLVVIGKHAALTPEQNAEVARAFELRTQNKIEIFSFPQLLKEITKHRENILCVGSYGKSTTTAILSHTLESVDLDVGYFIGAAPFTPSSNAHIGKHKSFILEGDEYPSANWDITSKFLHLNANSILLTSLYHDHVNIFKTHADYKKPFLDLIKQITNNKDQITNNKKIVLCLDDKSINEELENIKNIVEGDTEKNTEIITYSLENNTADYFGGNISFGEVSKFTLFYKNQKVLDLETTLLGKHNIQNIIGVCAIIFSKNLLNKESAEDLVKLFTAIKSFKGVKRRLDLLSEGKQIKIYEGFGSSYEKARAAIDAILLHFPNKKLVILFEPHTFSWRNREALYWYDDVFKEAQIIFVYQPPTHGEADHAQVSQNEIIERIKLSPDKTNKDQEVIKLNKGIEDVDFIISKIDSDSVLLILSSGDMGGIIKVLPQRVL